MIRYSRALLIGGGISLALGIVLFELERAPAANFRPIFPNKQQTIVPFLNNAPLSTANTPATPGGAYGLAGIANQFTNSNSNNQGNNQGNFGGGQFGGGQFGGGQFGGGQFGGGQFGGGQFGGFGGGQGGGFQGGFGGFGGGQIGGFGGKQVGFSGCYGL
jgi:hypothetical protein